MEEKPTYDELAKRVAFLENQLQQQNHLDIFFRQASDGFFFMMVDEPVYWNDDTDKEATLEYLFAHHKITRFNKAMLKQNHMTAEQYEGLTLNDIYQENRDEGKRLWKAFLDGGSWELEQEIHSLNTKKPFIVQCKYEAIYDKEGRFCGHFGVHRDVTEEKASAQKFTEEQRFSEAVLNSLDANICVLDQEGEIIKVNDAWKQFAQENDGSGDKTGITMNYLQVCHIANGRGEKGYKDTLEASKASSGIQLVLNNKTDHFSLEYPCHGINGEERWFFMNVTALKRPEGGAVVSHVNITPLKKVSGELKLKEAHLRLQELVITHLNDAILITEAEPYNEPGPRILFANPAFTRMTGYTQEEVLGRNPRFLQGPKTNRDQLDKIRTALENWNPIEIELINYTKGGKEFWVNFSIVPIADETGWYTHWVSVQKDITERKQQEELLRQNEEKYRTLFEEAPMGVVVFDPSSRKVIEYNEQAAKMLGYTLEEFRELDLLDYVVNTPEGFEEVAELSRKQPAVTFEQETKNKDGSIGHMLVTVKRLLLQEQELLLSIRLDRTTQKNFERQLKNFFDVSNDLIAIAGFDGYFIQLNNAWTRVLGYSHEELKSKPWIEWIHPDDRKVTLDAVAEGFEGQKTEFLVNRYRHKNGQYVWLEWTAVHNVSEEITYASARDITEEKLAKQKLTINEAKYRTLFEESPEGILLIDSDNWKPLEFNDKVLDILGYERAEFSQMSPNRYLVDDAEQAQLKAIEELLRQQDSLELELKMYDKHLEEKIILAQIKYLQLGNKQVFFNIWTDITEKKKAAEQIRLVEGRFRHAIDSSMEAIYILEAVHDDQGEVIDFTFEDMNLVGERQLDFLGIQVKGQRLCEIHPINREEGYFDRYKQVFLSGETFDGEFPIYVEGYDPAWLHQTVVKFDKGVVLTARDVTLRRTATESIRKSEERFRTAINSSLDAFYILDAFYDENGEVTDFTFVDANTVAFQSINLPKEKILNHKLCEILPINREQGFFEKYKKVFLTGETLDEEVYLENAHLNFSWVHHTIVKLKNGIAITTRDITQRKTYEAQLEELNEGLKIRNHTLSVQEEELSQANEELRSQQEQLKYLLEQITTSEEKFRSIAENIKDVFWIRKGANIEYISPAYEQIWQRTVESLYENGHSFIDTIHRSDQTRIKAIFHGEEYRKTGLFDEEYRVVRPDGSTRWVLARTYPVEVSESVFHVVGIGKDITEAKEAEVRLQELNVALAIKNKELITQEEELRLTNEELKANQDTLEMALERLGRSENNLKALFDSSEQAIVLLDTSFRIIAFNKVIQKFHSESFLRLFKEGGLILDCFSENKLLQEAYREKFEKCLEGGVIVFERQLNYPDLTNIRWIETTLHPVRDQQKQIIGLSFSEKDVTHKRAIELKLRKNEVRLRGLMNNTIQSFFLLDTNMRLLLFNTSAEKYAKKAFGKKLKLGESFFNFIPEYLKSVFQEKFQEALDGKMVAGERKIIYENGQEAWFDVTYALINNARGEDKMVVFSTLDITQRKLAQERERRLLQKQIENQLKQERLNRAAILEGQEQERHRISRELHDGVGQMLSALSYQINHLETTLEETQTSLVSEVYENLVKHTAERAKQLLKEVIQEIREISHNLMPKILTDYGLIEALKQLRLDFASTTYMPINLDVFCESDRFEDNIEISIFRITQEAINNILKYAQATEINIQLIEHATNLQLLVEDNGVGFDLEGVKRKNTNGLINMEERAKLVDGALSIDTEQGKGTCIMVEIPLLDRGQNKEKNKEKNKDNDI